MKPKEIRKYGNGGTIHNTGTIDIDIDPKTGAILAVWFRCMALPFRITVRDVTAYNPDIEITAIEFQEEP